MQPWLIAVVVAATAAVGFYGGVLTEREDVTYGHFRHTVRPLARLRVIVPDTLLQPRATGAAYKVLGRTTWRQNLWGKNCSEIDQPAADAKNASRGQRALCELPSLWQNCTQGIYLDMGTNVGGQLRKLYNPWQFPTAKVLGLFNQTYGQGNRSRVCALGVEANPVHTPYLTTLNAYFKRKGYQALVLTDTAASIRTGNATLHQDHGSPVEWGASLTAGPWQKQNKNMNNTANITTFDLPAFLADVIRPLVIEIERQTGVRPPVGMKMDVEGAEYALLPALITNGALCDLTMIYLEPHRITFRDASAAAINMTIAEIELAFTKMRKANPRCNVQYSHLDDETYLHAHTQVPLPP